MVAPGIHYYMASQGFNELNVFGMCVLVQAYSYACTCVSIVPFLMIQLYVLQTYICIKVIATKRCVIITSSIERNSEDNMFSGQHLLTIPLNSHNPSLSVKSSTSKHVWPVIV